MRDNAPHAEQTGPGSHAKQMLWFSILAFALPVIVILGLVYYITGSPSAPSSQPDSAMDVARRLQKVGTVDLALSQASRAPMSGEEVYKAQCAACHATGVAGAPLFGDAAQWGPRLGQGFDVLVNSSLKGKNAMTPQGGGQFQDFEIARAVAYMANHAGGQFAEPPAPDGEESASAAAPAEAAPAAPAEAAAAQPEAAAPEASAEAAAPVAAAALPADAGKSLYDKACVTCHAAGVAGAPKLGDKEAWAPRLAKGEDALFQSSLNGLNAMPPRGASTGTDEEIKAAVLYMTASVK